MFISIMKIMFLPVLVADVSWNDNYCEYR